MPAHSPAELHALLQEAFNRRDAGALAALYEPDAVLVVSGIEVAGRDNIRRAFERLVAGRGRMTLETCAVIGSSLGIAVLHGQWSIESAGSGAGIRTSGLNTEVVRQQPDGTWMFVVDNPYTPECAGAPPEAA